MHTHSLSLSFTFPSLFHDHSHTYSPILSLYVWPPHRRSLLPLSPGVAESFPSHTRTITACRCITRRDPRNIYVWTSSGIHETYQSFRRPSFSRLGDGLTGPLMQILSGANPYTCITDLTFLLSHPQAHARLLGASEVLQGAHHLPSAQNSLRLPPPPYFLITSPKVKYH